VPDLPPPQGRRPPTAALLVIAALGLALRVAFGLGYWTHQPLTRDEQEYLSLARSLAAGQGFTYDDTFQGNTFLPFGRAPGYPLFLALVGGGAERSASVPAAVKIAQSIAGAAGVFMVGLIAWRLGARRASLAAATIAAVYPPLVWTAAYALSEALFWPVGLAAAWLIDRAASDAEPGGTPRPWLVLAGGAVTGIGILIRPTLLLFVPLVLLWLVARRRMLPAAALTAGLLLALVPWTARNYAHYGRLMLVASDGGVTFWTGNHPLATGDGDMAANPALKLANESLRARHPGLTEEAMEPIYYREAFAWIRAHPLAWIELECRKLFYLAVPFGPSYRVHSRLYFVASVLSYGLLLPCAIVGLARLGPRVARTPALWLMALSAVAAVLVFFMQERFRIPTIDPVLVILAGSAWADRSRTS
jgi:4-amino-4-deoxy-L-arabinose transferase-like glycosyltransferase